MKVLERLYNSYFWIIFLGMKGLWGQGCSDAGFCTVNGLKPSFQDTSMKKNQLSFNLSYGQADISVQIISSYLEYSRQLNAKFSLNLRLSSLQAQGHGFSTWGFSDIFVTGQYEIAQKLSTIAGIKIPLGDGNMQQNGKSLPMVYQPSLGTWDLLIGFRYQLGKLLLALGLQYPLTQNKNEFLTEMYPMDSPLQKLASTNRFERCGDLLFRTALPIKWRSLQITPTLLPIYHICNDKYTDAMGNKKSIEGSSGLTLNANLFFDYKINSTHQIQFAVGAPLLIREVRPDGLTRHFVLNATYQISF